MTLNKSRVPCFGGRWWIARTKVSATQQGGALGEVPSAGQLQQKRARDVVASVAHPAHVARWVPGLFVACRAPNAKLATTIEATTG